MPRILATADIGSNTCHLLVASTDGTRLQRLVNETEWLSLGEIVTREGIIPEPLTQKLLNTVENFQRLADAQRAEKFYVFATEAMRLATNHTQVVEEIFQKTGVQVDIITPVREVELSLRGVQLDSPTVGPTLLIEVGGGSAQIARCEDGKTTHQISLPLGSGRLIGEVGLTHPPSVGQLTALNAWIEKKLRPCHAFPSVSHVVSSGGLARGLIRALHPDGERTVHQEELEYAIWVASKHPVETLMARFGVKYKRAATLLPGAAVYLATLKVFRHVSMKVSDYGVREGAILELFAENL
jgi:exopolyphosphatase/guanosine-5'-triphosphate,3'-diphosphate pyrophosphatase